LFHTRDSSFLPRSSEKAHKHITVYNTKYQNPRRLGDPTGGAHTAPQTSYSWTWRTLCGEGRGIRKGEEGNGSLRKGVRGGITPTPKKAWVHHWVGSAIPEMKLLPGIVDWLFAWQD